MKSSILILAAFGLGCVAGYRTAPRVTIPGKVTVLTRVDTLTVVRPVEVRRTRIAYAPVALPVAAAADSDSATVLVPIESRVYEGADYRAYVSGFRPSLDSLKLLRQVSVVTTAPRPSRWSVGLQAGYGITPRGFQPYIGLGVEFRFIAF